MEMWVYKENKEWTVRQVLLSSCSGTISQSSSFLFSSGFWWSLLDSNLFLPVLNWALPLDSRRSQLKFSSNHSSDYFLKSISPKFSTILWLISARSNISSGIFCSTLPLFSKKKKLEKLKSKFQKKCQNPTINQLKLENKYSGGDISLFQLIISIRRIKSWSPILLPK